VTTIFKNREQIDLLLDCKKKLPHTVPVGLIMDIYQPMTTHL